MLGFLFRLLDLTLHQCQLLTYKQDLGGTLSVVGSPGCQMFQVWTSVSNCCPQLLVYLCLWAKEQALMSFNDSFTTKSKLN